MTSLQNIVSKHAPILVIDCASARIHVGIFLATGESHWTYRDAEAGNGLFSALEEVLRQAGLPLEQCGAYAFNEGPGSILGIRTSAVALRAWLSVYPRPTYAFQGLTALAEALKSQGSGSSFSVIADARRESWHTLRIEGESPLVLTRQPTAQLQGPFVTPATFRSWSARPTPCTEVNYEPSQFLAAVIDLPLFRATDAPDAYLTEDPNYVTWTAQVHRAPH